MSKSMETSGDVDTQETLTESDSAGDPASASADPPDRASIPRPSPLRLVPALAIIVAMWVVILVPAQLVPLTLFHFMSVQFGPILCILALSIWWLTSRAILRRERWLGWLLVLMTAVGVVIGSHSSMTIPMLIYGIPTALSLLIAALFLMHARPWRSRRWMAYVVYAGFLVGTLFFRIGEIDAAFRFTLVPRNTPTAEDELLAHLEANDSRIIGMSELAPLPEQPRRSDWAEFRGPRRDGRIQGVSFATDWEVNRPRERWRRAVGPAWSSFCIVAPLVFTQEQRGDDEMVVAYRVDDGAEVWVQSIDARFAAAMGGVGPRATPTYASGRLYVSGATGKVQCLNASTGQQVWSFDLVEQLEIGTPDWGFCSSPLVHHGLVIVCASGGDGKDVIALDQADGSLRWSTGDGTHTYSSPQLAIIDGQEQVVVSNNRGLRGMHSDDGTLLWQHDWDIGQMARVTQPLVVGSSVYLGTGYGNGTERVTVAFSDGRWDVQGGWVGPLKPYFNDFVFYDGHLYGFDNEIFTSIDAVSGERNWKRGRYGFGQVLCIDQMGILLIISENGNLVLLQASPDQHVEIASIKALTGVTWNHPVIADGKLFLRNAEEAVCYELPGFRSTTVPADGS